MDTAVKSATSQYLSFILLDEVFAVDIAKVREVLEYTSVTKIPQMPTYMRGVINLRGGVVPVIDMRLKFGMSETEKTINTCVIITEVYLKGESVILGALADSVQEVFDLLHEDIEPAPKIGTQLDTDFLMGMGKKNGDFILILDIDKVFSMGEKMEIKRIGEEARAEKSEGVEIEMA